MVRNHQGIHPQSRRRLPDPGESQKKKTLALMENTCITVVEASAFMRYPVDESLDVQTKYFGRGE